MTIRFNDHLLLWGIAVLQPASAADVLRFIKMMFPDAGKLPGVKDVRPTIDRWVEGGQLSRVHGKSRLYSVTAKGNHLMPVTLRRARDKARLFLLKEAHLAKVKASGEAPKRLAGDSPAETGSSNTQGARSISTAASPRDARLSVRAYWPRVVKQLQVGSEWRSPDIILDLFSFPSVETLYAASDRPAEAGDLSVTDLGLAIGISPRLLTSFMHRSDNHYREFTIGKRGGGERTISSPRLFLKTVQYWLLDYLLYQLPQHPSCHAYRRGASIVTNAEVHVRKRYVANVDVRDFFPSIRWEAVARVLLPHGFGPKLAMAVARLTSLRDGLPQGAPTSPALSNVYMFDVDEFMSQYCTSKDIDYTRYADDITFSAQDRKAILHAIGELRKRLWEKGLELNNKKTRIASSSGQQKVVGVVVNRKAQPPRKYRRRIRAMLHQAPISLSDITDPVARNDRLAELRGHVSYLSAFPSLKGSPDLERYRAVLRGLSKKV